ncbi:MAG TPA: hypothetical protein VG712_01945, partial [Gemmatimonadales bacterium]|nr:hypothetical protein [Gemmatimonadales bacterium]
MSRASRSAASLLTVIAALVATIGWGLVRVRPHGAIAREADGVPAPITARRTATAHRPVGAGRSIAAEELDPSAGTAPADAEVPLAHVRPTAGRAAPIVSAATPRSIHVLRVPVPRALDAAKRVDWEMHPGRRAEVLSAGAGSIPARSADTARAITVVTRIPAQASAGLLPVGEAEFFSDSVSVIVPIELEIARIRRATLSSARPTFGAISGRPLTLSVEARNLGNSIDTLVIAAELPAGWASTPSQRVVLIPGERRVVPFQTRIPAAMGTTAAYPSFSVALGDSVVATTSTPAQVQDPTETTRPAGPQLTIGSSSAFGDTVASSAAFDFALTGQVSDGIWVIGRADYVMDEGTLDRRALARAGAYLGGAFLNVRGPGWYGTVGNTGNTLSTLTGIGAYGTGVSGGATHGNLSGTAMLTSVTNGSGLQGGARADMSMGRSTIGVSGSHFEDAGPSARALDAFGLIGTVMPGAGFRITAEGAWRQYTGGSGAGAALSIDRTTDHEILSLSAAHAPGGSQAFGRALNDVTGVYSRRFSDHLTLQTNAFSSVDRPPTAGGKYTASGWSAGPRISLPHDLSAEVEVRHNEYRSESPTSGGFASGEMLTGATVRKDGGKLLWSAGFNFGTSDRTTTLGSGTSVTISSGRTSVNGGASLVLPRAVLSAGADYSRSGSGSGLAPRQARLTLGASRIAISSSPRTPLLRLETEFTSWFGDQPATTIARIGAEVPLPSDFSLVVDAERNPQLRAPGQTTPWIVAFRLERTFGISWAASTPMTRGSVFQDRNANGVRDSDEPGMAGVLLRRGSQTAVTDASGRYA